MNGLPPHPVPFLRDRWPSDPGPLGIEYGADLASLSWQKEVEPRFPHDGVSRARLEADLSHSTRQKQAEFWFSARVVPVGQWGAEPLTAVRLTR